MIWARDAKKQHDNFICIGWREMVGLLEVGTSEAEERNPQKKIVEQGEG